MLLILAQPGDAMMGKLVGVHYYDVHYYADMNVLNYYADVYVSHCYADANMLSAMKITNLEQY